MHLFPVGLISQHSLPAEGQSASTPACVDYAGLIPE